MPAAIGAFLLDAVTAEVSQSTQKILPQHVTLSLLQMWRLQLLQILPQHVTLSLRQKKLLQMLPQHVTLSLLQM